MSTLGNIDSIIVSYIFKDSATASATVSMGDYSDITYETLYEKVVLTGYTCDVNMISPIEAEGQHIALSNLTPGSEVSVEFTGADTVSWQKYTRQDVFNYEDQVVGTETNYVLVVTYEATGEVQETSFGSYEDAEEAAVWWNSQEGFSASVEEREEDVIESVRIPPYYTDWDLIEDVTDIHPLDPKSVTIYMHPDTFYFKDSGPPSSGEKWQVDLGIQSLLTNIYNFNAVAEEWANWDSQSGGSVCNAFISGPLSAEMLREAYACLNEISPYSSGDVISAEMFNGLERIINAYGEREVVS